MRHFTFDVLHANGMNELRDRLNDSGLNGFEIKHISRMDQSWVAVMQRETDMSELDLDSAMEAPTPKGENL